MTAIVDTEFQLFFEQIDAQLNKLYYVRAIPLLEKAQQKYRALDKRKQGELSVMKKILEHLVDALDNWTKHILFRSVALRPYKEQLLKHDEENVLLLFDLLLKDKPVLN